MAHWHDFNPWADRLIYIPDEYDAAWLVNHERPPSEELEYWHHQGPKIDVYMLKGPNLYSLGVRFGPDGPNYLSPYIDQKRAARLWEKYS